MSTEEREEERHQCLHVAKGADVAGEAPTGYGPVRVCASCWEIVRYRHHVLIPIPPLDEEPKR